MEKKVGRKRYRHKLISSRLWKLTSYKCVSFHAIYAFAYALFFFVRTSEARASARSHCLACQLSCLLACFLIAATDLRAAARLMEGLISRNFSDCDCEPRIRFLCPFALLGPAATYEYLNNEKRNGSGQKPEKKHTLSITGISC